MQRHPKLGNMCDKAKEKEKRKEWRNSRESGNESLSYKFSAVPWVNHSVESIPPL